MSSPITFTSVSGPLATDRADGAGGFNRLADATEANYAEVNEWAARADTTLWAMGYVENTQLITPTSPWLFHPSYRSFGVKWGAVSFISVCLYCTGTIIDQVSGNIDAVPMGTLVPAYRPPQITYAGAVVNDGFPCEVTITTLGVVSMRAVGATQTIPALWPVNLCLAWINFDASPI